MNGTSHSTPSAVAEEIFSEDGKVCVRQVTGLEREPRDRGCVVTRYDPQAWYEHVARGNAALKAMVKR